MGTQLLSDNVTKIHNINVMGFGKCAVAVCGALNIIGPWKANLATNGFEPMPDMFDLENVYAEAIVVSNKGKARYCNIFGHWYDVDFAPYCLGSGQDLAMNAMHNGATAIEAVRAVIKSELSCGGNIQTYDWRAKRFEVVPL